MYSPPKTLHTTQIVLICQLTHLYPVFWIRSNNPRWSPRWPRQKMTHCEFPIRKMKGSIIIDKVPSRIWYIRLLLRVLDNAEHENETRYHAAPHCGPKEMTREEWIRKVKNKVVAAVLDLVMTWDQNRCGLHLLYALSKWPMLECINNTRSGRWKWTRDIEKGQFLSLLYIQGYTFARVGSTKMKGRQQGPSCSTT